MRQIGGKLRVSHPQIPFGGPMPFRCCSALQGLHQSDETLPFGMVHCANQARPEGATLSAILPCSKDTGYSGGAANLSWRCTAGRLLPQ